MSLGLAFWIIMLMWLLFWGVGVWGGPAGGLYWARVGWLPLFVLLGLLGWHVFGPPLH